MERRLALISNLGLNLTIVSYRSTLYSESVKASSLLITKNRALKQPRPKRQQEWQRPIKIGSIEHKNSSARASRFFSTFLWRLPSNYNVK